MMTDRSTKRTELPGIDAWKARLAGRAALVTGAGRGLGRVIALALGACGMRVVLSGRDRANLQATADLADAEGIETLVAPVDVSDESSVTSLARSLEHETISVLINNAGIPGPVAPLSEVTVEEWDEVFAVNVRGIFLMCKAFIPPMVQRGSGDVINLASVSGKRPLARRSPYCASKMAVIGLTVTLAAEVGPSGVNVNSLSPGPVAGERMWRIFALEAKRTGTSVEEAERVFRSRTLLDRLIEEREVGYAVVAMLNMPGLAGADIDLSAGMVAR
jgi:NAD(P)-dependent dehydrogenase (short-subunit alcohol dehydrogenase family)